MPKKLTPTIVAEIERLYFEEKLSSQAIAEQLHLGGGSKVALKYLHRTGRPLRDPGWPEGRRQLARLGKALPQLAPTEHPTLLDIAWAAGIFEGEGCVTKQKYGVGIMVSQKDPELLYRLKALFGGRISHGFQSQTNKWSEKNPISRWDLQGPRARGFLMTTYRFYTNRRRSAIRAAFEMSGVIRKAA